MIEIILITVGSKVVSYTISLSCALSIMKKMADEGYTFSKDINDTIDAVYNSNDTIKRNSTARKIISYIPVINIIQSSIDYIEVKIKLSEALTTAHVLGLFDRMTISEQKQYDENPNAFEALRIYLNRYKSSTEITLDLKSLIGEEGTITYVGNSLENAKVISASGYGALLTDDKKTELLERFVFRKKEESNKEEPIKELTPLANNKDKITENDITTDEKTHQEEKPFVRKRK